MSGFAIVLLVLCVITVVIAIIRYNTGDPFDQCGRRVYADF